MREILFRAKSCVGSWVYGYLKKQMVGDKADVWAIQTEIPEGEKPMFIPPTSKQNAYTTRLYENVVDPATVGQFTGLTDRDGNKIFEGDIIRIAVSCETTKIGEVIWHSERPGFLYCPQNINKNEQLRTGYCTDYFNKGEIEVIGNIHDNPELMEV